MTDTFRKEFKELDINVGLYMREIKEGAEMLEGILKRADVVCNHDKRCMSLAYTNLEQAIMWAIKSVTL